jgi:hypothetical protein
MNMHTIPRPSFMITAIVAIVAWNALSPIVRADHKEAKQRFYVGVERFKQQDYLGALQSFRESYRSEPKSLVLYNIGMCQKALYQYIDAIASLDEYLKEVGSTVPEKRRQQVDEEIAALRQLLGNLRLIGAPEGLIVYVDGRLRTDTPLPDAIAIDPGDHQLQLTGVGYEPFERFVTVKPGETVSVNVELTPEKSRLNAICSRDDSLLIDGRVSGRCPYTGEVEPGDHWLALSSNHGTTSKRLFTFRRGERVVVNFFAKDAVLEKSENSARDSNDDRRDTKGISTSNRLLAAASFAGSVGAAIVGGYFVYQGNQDYEKGKEAARTGNAGQYDRIKEKRLPWDRVGAVTGFLVSGALLGAGILVIVMSGSEQEQGSIAKLFTDGYVGGIKHRF